MITNERQYKITRKKLTKLQEAQALSDQHSESLPEVLKTAMRAGIEAQIQDLKSELEEYLNFKYRKIIADVKQFIVREKNRIWDYRL